MERVALDRLALRDLQGNAVGIEEYFQTQFLLLIFLRHLA